ncbi:MAG: hypothetical protein SGILL_001348, partial [Bacillariaceae sp.]
MSVVSASARGGDFAGGVHTSARYGHHAPDEEDESAALDDEIRSMEFGGNVECDDEDEFETREEVYEDFAVIIEMDDVISKEDSECLHTTSTAASSEMPYQAPSEQSHLQTSRMKKRMLENQLAGWIEGKRQVRPSRRNSTGSHGLVVPPGLATAEEHRESSDTGGDRSRTMPDLVEYTYQEPTRSISKSFSCPKSPTSEHSLRSATESILSMADFSSPEANKAKRRAGRRASMGSVLKNPDTGSIPVVPVTTGGWISDILGPDEAALERLASNPPVSNSNRNGRSESSDKSHRASNGSTNLLMDDRWESMEQTSPRRGSLVSSTSSQRAHALQGDRMVNTVSASTTTLDIFMKQEHQVSQNRSESLRPFSSKLRQVPRLNSGASMADTIDDSLRGADDSLPQPLKLKHRDSKVVASKRRRGRRNSTGSSGFVTALNSGIVKPSSKKYPILGRRGSADASTTITKSFDDHIDSRHLMRGSMDEKPRIGMSNDVAPFRPERQISVHVTRTANVGVSGHQGLRSKDEKGSGIMTMKKYAPVTQQIKEEVNHILENPIPPSSGLSLNSSCLLKGSSRTACTSNMSSFASSPDKPISVSSNISGKRRGKRNYDK